MSAPDPSSGAAWLVGARLLRPRHLPLALWLVATLLYGTIAGALLYEHPYVAAAVITAIWLAAWRGLALLNAADSPRDGRTRRALDRRP